MNIPQTFRPRKNEDGFTLIEVIAVLIILGILLAVAAPKYFDISEEARLKAYDGALAQGLSLVSLAYGKAALIVGEAPSVQEVMRALRGEDITDTSSSTAEFGLNPPPSGTGFPAVVTSTDAPVLKGDFGLSFTMDTTAGSEGITVEAWHHSWNETSLSPRPSQKWLLP